MRRLVGLCVMGLLACGTEAARTPVAHTTEQALRPTDTGSDLLWRYQPSDDVTSIAMDGGLFRVHYTSSGTNAVPSLAFVQDVENVYEEVGALYHGPLGYRRPLSDGAIQDNGGDDRFDVYLLDFAGSADGSFRVDQCPTADHCIGYVVQENDFAGYGYPSLTEATRILGSHEYFHAVQAAYNANQVAVVSEGTAVWATERFDPSATDFENFIDGYLNEPNRSLDSAPSGPVPAFAYGSAIFFKFLSEKHGDQIIRELWEALETQPSFIVALDGLLQSKYETTFADDFALFTKWNLFLGSASDAAQAWADSSAYPPVKMTSATLPFDSGTLRLYYASSQYFTAPAGSRSVVKVQVRDTDATSSDDREDVRTWVAERKNGRIVSVAEDQISVSGGEVIVVVVNTRRAQVGTVSSQRPALCVGSAEEVSACMTGPVVDAGVPDAGSNTPDAGTEAPSPPSGCGCGMAPGPFWLVGLLMLVFLKEKNR